MIKRISAILLLLLLPVFASAQTVSCPEAGMTLEVPDSYLLLPGSPDEPELVLHMADQSMDLAVYVSFVGRNAGNDLFQILTGDELDYGSVQIGGVDMLYVRGRDDDGDYQMYSWLMDSDNVSVYFLWRGDEKKALRAVDDIMNSIVFD